AMDGLLVRESDDRRTPLATPRHDVVIWGAREPRCRQVLEPLNLEDRLCRLAPRARQPLDEHDAQALVENDVAQAGISKHRTLASRAPLRPSEEAERHGGRDRIQPAGYLAQRPRKELDAPALGRSATTKRRTNGFFGSP